MKYLWTYIDRKNWHASAKYKAAMLILGAICALAGFALWMVLSTRALNSPDWMLCFTGYSAAAAWIAVLAYSGKHDFHDGSC